MTTKLWLISKTLSTENSFDRLTGEPVEPEMEDPDVVAARKEQEKRRKDKHRRMEADREQMRQQIRDKYKIKKKEEAREQEIAGRIAGNRRTPEQVAIESIQAEDDDGIVAVVVDTIDKAKDTVVGVFNTVKNMATMWKS